MSTTTQPNSITNTSTRSWWNAAYGAIPVVALAAVVLSSSGVFFRRSLSSVLFCSISISLAAFIATQQAIPKLCHYFLRRGLSGKDLNKAGAKEDKPDVPESLGVVCGIIFIISVISSQLIYADKKQFLTEFNAGLFSICFMIFLGFLDDVVELPWRYKLLLPTFASLPLLTAYAGATTIVVPNIANLDQVLGRTLDLGIFYQVYMGLLAVFCTNAINIYAGINGLEAGQSFVIGIAVAIHNVIELSGDFYVNHLFSLLLILPFIAVTAGLLNHNWYPSSVFVGDTFTYFAGMTFAVTGILGHFSKTLLLFFIPQIINFLYSLPQMLRLFGLTCPRHRLPQYSSKDNMLHGVPSHHNFVNLVLLLTGPMHERSLCLLLMFIQVLSCAFGFAVRYYISTFFYH